jgi:hypothetical protein
VLIALEEVGAALCLFPLETRLIIGGVTMRRIIHIGILLTGVLLAIDSSGQQSTETMESITAHLTGGTKRTWTGETWIPVLGPEPRCLQGEIWTFSHDGGGVKMTCESGMAREREFTWALVDRSVVQIDETQYIAELRHEKATGEGAWPVLVTILRTPRTSPMEPVKEITLRFHGGPGKGKASGEEPAVPTRE